MALKLAVDRNALLEELRGERDCVDPAYKIMRECENLGLKIEAREVEGHAGEKRWEVFSATGMPEELKREVKVHRDALIRGIWMRDALAFLAKRGVPYVPLDVEEDIDKSFDEDDLEGFRGVVRGWIVELTRRSA